MPDNTTPQSHCAEIVEEFEREFTQKYLAGAKEHGGGLWKFPLLELITNAIGEAHDQIAYLHTARECAGNIHFAIDMGLLHGAKYAAAGRWEEAAKAYERGLFSVYNLLNLGHVPDDSTCRVCGCTQDHACPGGCHWVEPNLCSACVENADQYVEQVIELADGYNNALPTGKAQFEFWQALLNEVSINLMAYTKYADLQPADPDTDKNLYLGTEEEADHD